MQPLHAHPSQGGAAFTALPTLIIAACTALVFLAATAVFALLLLRPLLKVLHDPLIFIFISRHCLNEI